MRTEIQHVRGRGLGLAAHPGVRPSNPYGELRSLLDTTRALSPEEQAELLLEQGYVEQALAVYERLVAAQPEVFYLRQRRDWLARLAGPRGVGAESGQRVDGTLRGVRAPSRAVARVEVSCVRSLSILPIE